MKAFQKSKKWRIILWSVVLVLLAALFVSRNLVVAWPGKVIALLCCGLAWYAVLLSYRAGKGKVRRVLCVLGIVALSYASLTLPVALLGTARRPVEYITSPNGENTAVVIRESFTATGYSVHPLHCKFLIRSDEGIQLGLDADPPDTAQFVWVDENTLQFADENGKTLTIRF